MAPGLLFVYTDVGDGPVALAVANSVPPQREDDMTAWYEQEHIPMLLDVPGWRRIRRFRLTGPPPLGDGVGFLSLHELAGPAVLSETGYRAAVSTPWRAGSCPARCAGNVASSVFATLSAEPLACGRLAACHPPRARARDDAR